MLATDQKPEPAVTGGSATDFLADLMINTDACEFSSSLIVLGNQRPTTFFRRPRLSTYAPAKQFRVQVWLSFRWDKQPPRRRGAVYPSPSLTEPMPPLPNHAQQCQPQRLVVDVPPAKQQAALCALAVITTGTEAETPDTPSTTADESSTTA